MHEIPEQPPAPLGLIPRQIHDLDRAKNIAESMVRFLDAGMSIPPEWMAEFDYINGIRIQSGIPYSSTPKP